MSLIDLFNKCKEFGKKVRYKTLHSIDNGGSRAWQPIKELLDDKIIISDNWNINRIIGSKNTNNIDDIYNYMYCFLKIKGDDIDEKRNIENYQHYNWELYHFFYKQ